jgi:predicted kinase
MTKAALVILGGLPGVGKTSLARELAGQIGTVHLRIDSIEQALRDSGVLLGPMDAAGYHIAYALAADNLRIGNMVIADSVNPIFLTRAAWRAVAAAVPTPAFEIEIVCSDANQHRRGSRPERPTSRGWCCRHGKRCAPANTIHGEPISWSIPARRPLSRA